MDRNTNTAERAAITLEGLIEKASQILDLAIAERQFSSAVAALQERSQARASSFSGRICGFAAQAVRRTARRLSRRRLVR